MLGDIKHKVPEIDASEVFKEIQAKKDVQILDVRTEAEYSRGNIVGSINIPVDKVSLEVEKILPDKNKTTYVYCLSGSRSTVAVEEMMKIGYKNVYSMTSGLLSWRSKQYPLSTDPHA